MSHKHLSGILSGQSLSEPSATLSKHGIWKKGLRLTLEAAGLVAFVIFFWAIVENNSHRIAKFLEPLLAYGVLGCSVYFAISAVWRLISWIDPKSAAFLRPHILSPFQFFGFLLPPRPSSPLALSQLPTGKSIPMSLERRQKLLNQLSPLSLPALQIAAQNISEAHHHSGRFMTETEYRSAFYEHLAYTTNEHAAAAENATTFFRRRILLLALIVPLILIARLL